MTRTNKLLNVCDHLALLGATVILTVAFAFQFTDSELPCALCVMQRMGYYAISFGLVLNLVYGRQIKHYLLVGLSAVINGWIGLLQVTLHIVPGSGSYGAAIWGLHMYTWNYINSTLYLIYAFGAGLATTAKASSHLKIQVSGVSKLVIGLLLISLLANLLSTLAECGPYLCPSDPHSYWITSWWHGIFGA
jgi:disulfide bond formation protein DsbB